MESLTTLGKQAKSASKTLAKLDAPCKNSLLLGAADALVQQTDRLIAANNKDMENAQRMGMRKALQDRLVLTKARIADMADGLRALADLPDPTQEFVSMKTLDNGLVIGQKRVPLGVVAIIYEARPNVTADAFGLCLKSGNACILRGGSEAIYSNEAIVAVLQESLQNQQHDPNYIQLVTDTDRKTATELMRLNAYIDVLIPRGGKGLIESVVLNSTVPIIETGIGNCHIYVDEFADLDMATDVIINAKVQRPSVCNACETLLIHQAIAEVFTGRICQALADKGVEIRADGQAKAFYQSAKDATEQDWITEYGDYIIAIKVVDSMKDAMAHIASYGTMHSEVIITQDYANAQQFLNEVDAAAVYVNASSRFTDGFEFGFGAEIGISTQKLHARGPMGLRELTTTKYIIYGNGQIRQ